MNMQKIETKQNLEDKMICTFLIICAILGNVITLGGIKIAGIVLTLYRMGTPIICLYCLMKRVKERRIKDYFENKLYILGLLILLFWFFYGGILILISPYSGVREGLKEILNIALAVALVYSFAECCKTREMLLFCFKIIKGIIIFLVVYGMIELIVGLHLYTSRYAWDYSKMTLLQAVAIGMKQKDLFPVTTIFFGTNDFSAFMAIFFPILFVEKQSKNKIGNYILMALVVFLLSVNDANICLLAISFVSVLFLLVTKFNKYGLIKVGVVLTIQLWLTKIFSNSLIFFKKVLYKVLGLNRIKIDKNLLLDAIGINMSLQEALVAQLQTAVGEHGSLYERILLMRDALSMWLDSYLLGMGPASYDVYVRKIGTKSKYVNPHNWWLEILSQYGIAVFLAYVSFLFYIFVKCIKQYLKEKDMFVFKYICILILYVICSIAPSSFIAYSYQWLIMAMGMVMVKTFKR